MTNREKELAVLVERFAGMALVESIALTNNGGPAHVAEHWKRIRVEAIAALAMPVEQDGAISPVTCGGCGEEVFSSEDHRANHSRCKAVRS